MRNGIQCYQCGGINPAGQGHCSWCGSRFYYSCPHCGAWVDSSYSNCPNCRQALNWSVKSSKTNANKGTSGIIFALTATAILFAAAFILIENNSSPAKQPLYSSSSSPVSASQPEQSSVTMSFQSGSSTVSPQAQLTYTPPIISPENDASADPVTIDMIIPLTPDSSSNITPTVYKPKRSAYLQQIAPNWGRCTGGSCRSYSQ